MRQIWNNKNEQQLAEGQPVPQRIKLFPEQYHRAKSVMPSQQAMDTYNSIETTVDAHTYDNLCFVHENSDPYNSNFSTMSSTKPLNGAARKIPALDDYATIRSSSMATNTIAGSDADLDKANEKLGSTEKLVRPRFRDLCNTCLGYVQTALCTISLAFGLGNIYRLPQAVLGGGGLPFLIAYIILAILIGLPLLILEIGLGQIIQEGFMKTWRAVPFFRGVGYVKLLAGCLLSLYYPIYMGLSAFYLIWFAKGRPPFSECATVKMEETGYRALGISGQECLTKTFLESPFTDPFWYAILVAILFGVWFLTMAGLIKRTRTYVATLLICLVLALGCFVALIVRVFDDDEDYEGLEKMAEDADWSLLGTSAVWYYAAIQVFFASNVGFGIFVTNAGTIFKKVNPVWMAISFTFVHLAVGVVAVLMCYMFSHHVVEAPQKGDIIQAYVLSLIYDISLRVEFGDLAWPVIAYFLILFSGFISTITIMYTVLKALNSEMRSRWYWWQLSVFVGIFGLVLSAAVLLRQRLEIVHMLDHYIVGNLVLLTVIIEVFAFVCFYGSWQIQRDFEFILGHKLSIFWTILWWICPVILLGVLVWALATLPLNGYLDVDPIWLYATAWSVVLLALLFILVLGIYHITKQDKYYTFIDKLKAALKSSRKWGPVDPIMRYRWVQWHSKAKDGQRDFTLRRRGTKEYTHAVKNRSKYSARQYTPGDTSTVNLDFRKNDQNQNNITLMNVTNYETPYYATGESVYDRQMKVLSLVDTLQPSPSAPPQVSRHSYGGESYGKKSLNPLANVSELQTDNSEGYGTFRRGPFVIDGGDLEHVCHRKNSAYSEEATEL